MQHMHNMDMAMAMDMDMHMHMHMQIHILPRFHSKRDPGAGISQLAWRSNLAMVVLPMGATGPMQVGLQRLEAVRPWQHIFMRRCARLDGDRPEGWTCRGGVTTCHGGLPGCPPC